jgi:hypothetical protein
MASKTKAAAAALKLSSEVFVRIRPLLPQAGDDDNNTNIIRVVDGDLNNNKKSVKVHKSLLQNDELEIFREYGSFKNVFNEEYDNVLLGNELLPTLCSSVMGGGASTLFCFGHTGIFLSREYSSDW